MFIQTLISHYSKGGEERATKELANGFATALEKALQQAHRHAQQQKQYGGQRTALAQHKSSR